MHSMTPVVSTRLSVRDVLGDWKVRWGIGRNRYRVTPGLFAVGKPTPQSPVLVTANYKLTFDKLRAELSDIDAWILVLDTKGVNVWCAAGKGTFGTRELEQRVLSVGLEGIVFHRTLILPQLGATGVSAPQVQRETGWRVVFGPVRARDLREFLANGLKKNTSMRKVEFRLSDRMALAPIEIVKSWPFLLGAAAGSAILALPFDGGYPGRLMGFGMPLIGAVLAATIAFPALLPILPFRAFSLKGAVMGAAWGVVASLLVRAHPAGSFAFVIVAAAVAAFLGMNFTGSTTFTCQTGAELEVRWGTIPMIVGLALGAGLLTVSRVLGI